MRSVFIIALVLGWWLAKADTKYGEEIGYNADVWCRVHILGKPPPTNHNREGA